MKRYSIIVQEYGADHAVELMQVDANPGAVTEGLKRKMLTIRRSLTEPGKRVVKVPKYVRIEVIDHGAGHA